MLKQMSSFIGYIAWLFEKQKELQHHCNFKIIDIQNKAGEIHLTVQVANKSTVFYCKPAELICNDRLLEQFSKHDIRTITYYATQESMAPKYHIISHRLAHNMKTICKIKNAETKKFEEKSLKDILLNKSIKEFTPEDAERLGYLKAMEESIQEHLFFNPTL